ncbi:hypothetical protein LTS14_010542 [Recurvomyces mirabilis]|uniref:uncharacterized protein n=1 Tax=Recurvomyces mirabilis TaxID=574656 RepID=UPI002DE08F28|nr:hypothetical protein LTS14_010542 [Recurvomyces mirabilis]
MTRRLTPCLPKPASTTSVNQNEDFHSSSDDEPQVSPRTKSRSTFGSGTKLSDFDFDLMIKHSLYRDELPAFKVKLKEQPSTASALPQPDTNMDQGADTPASAQPAGVRIMTAPSSTPATSTSALPQRIPMEQGGIPIRLGGMSMRNISAAQGLISAPTMGMPSPTFGPGYTRPYPNGVLFPPMPMLSQHMSTAYPPGLQSFTGAPSYPAAASPRDPAPIGLEQPSSDIRLNISDPINDKRYAVYLDFAMLRRRCPFLEYHDECYRNSLAPRGHQWQISFEAPCNATSVCLQYAASGIMLPPVDLCDIFDTLVMASSWQMEELAMATYCHFVQEAMQLPCNELGQLLLLFAKAHSPDQRDCGDEARVAVNKAVASRATELLADPQLLEMLTTMGNEAVSRFTKVLAVQLERSRRSANRHMLQRNWQPNGRMEVDVASVALFKEVSCKASSGTLKESPESPAVGSRHSWETAEAVPWPVERGSSTSASASHVKPAPSSSSTPGALPRVSHTYGAALPSTISSSPHLSQPRFMPTASGSRRRHRFGRNDEGNDSEGELDHDHYPSRRSGYQKRGQQSCDKYRN